MYTETFTQISNWTKSGRGNDKALVLEVLVKQGQGSKPNTLLTQTRYWTFRRSQFLRILRISIHYLPTSGSVGT
jgi:hypothetical protein